MDVHLLRGDIKKEEKVVENLRWQENAFSFSFSFSDSYSCDEQEGEDQGQAGRHHRRRLIRRQHKKSSSTTGSADVGDMMFMPNGVAGLTSSLGNHGFDLLGLQQDMMRSGELSLCSDGEEIVNG